MCVHAYMHGPPTHVHLPIHSPIPPIIILELNEIIEFCFQIHDPWTSPPTYRRIYGLVGGWIGRWGHIIGLFADL